VKKLNYDTFTYFFTVYSHLLQHKYAVNLKLGCLHPVACTGSGSGLVALDGNPEPDTVSKNTVLI
jgi:hypothetical protein